MRPQAAPSNPSSVLEDGLQFEAGLHQMQIAADVACKDALLQFVRLLQKWNRIYNLTAAADTETLIHRHIFDSLSPLPYITGTRVIDVGSGAGLPGIPLAIVCRDREFLLLDANAKKTRFIQQCIIEIGLENVQVRQQRIEDYIPSRGFDTVVSRALAPVQQLLAWVDHLLVRGRVLLMLGREHRLAKLPAGYHLEGMYPARVPHAQACRQIAVIDKRS